MALADVEEEEEVPEEEVKDEEKALKSQRKEGEEKPKDKESVKKERKVKKDKKEKRKDQSPAGKRKASSCPSSRGERKEKKRKETKEENKARGKTAEKERSASEEEKPEERKETKVRIVEAPRPGSSGSARPREPSRSPIRRERHCSPPPGEWEDKRSWYYYPKKWTNKGRTKVQKQYVRRQHGW
mmetsp:Transcript_8324/g.9974  ORF Transcript_8324/g.9974 Transcript_8324/m.9974 type:complete len:185 (+) Transcript_8324:153-707(+)